MISPDEIYKKAIRIYPAYLSSCISGESIFPKSIRSDKKPSKREIASLMKELVPLLERSKDKLGFGYKVHLKTVKSSRMAEQQLPEEIVFETETDYLKFLRKESEVTRFRENTTRVLSEFPQLKDWIVKQPQKIIDNNDKWDDILEVLNYFSSNPKPNLYLRELPIQVHTKFVEQNKFIIEELLTFLISEHINHSGKSFEERFHLKYYEPYFHIRILDLDIARHYFSGLTDIGIKPSELAALQLPVDRVIIMENKQNYKNVDNFLSIPHLKGTIALFGSGFHSGGLKNVLWLKEKQIYYWGDIDLHGFEILSALRFHFPHVQSFLMDEETFDKHTTELVDGKESRSNIVSGLTEGEMQLYLKLKTMSVKNRLEQEKILHEYVLNKINTLFS